MRNVIVAPRRLFLREGGLRRSTVGRYRTACQPLFLAGAESELDKGVGELWEIA
jgi:hypothetical protein